MSLFDLDKHSHNRSDPKTSGIDFLGTRKAHATDSVNYVTDATNLATAGGAENGRLKIVKVDTAIINSFGSGTPDPGQFLSGFFTLATKTHNLGYIPAFVGFLIDLNNNVFPLPHSSNTSNSWFSYNAIVTTSDVIITGNLMAYNSFVNFAGFTVKYFLLQQTVN